jgi:hypothetical protein
MATLKYLEINLTLERVSGILSFKKEQAVIQSPILQVIS